MVALLRLLPILLPILYGGLVYLFAQIFFRQGGTERQTRRILPIVYTTILLHALYIALFTIEHRHCLLASPFELASLMAFTLLVTYALVEIKLTREAAGSGFLIAACGFFFQTISSLFATPDSAFTQSVLVHDAVFNVHVTTAMLGYSALILASIYGSLYLLLYRSIQSNSFGAVFQHLPNLERLERNGILSSLIGFIFLTISIALGWVLLAKFPPGKPILSYLLDAKVLATYLIWLVFGLTVFVRKALKIEGRRVVMLWMSGFALTLISMTVINLAGTDFHNFH